MADQQQDGQQHPTASSPFSSAPIAKSSNASGSFSAPAGMSGGQGTDYYGQTNANSRAMLGTDNGINNNGNNDNKVVQALFTMAEARSAVDTLGRCWTELRDRCDQEKQIAELEQTCHQVAQLLDEEKKVHQAELKQINKDLNLLEDFLCDRKPRLAQKRAKCERKVDELLRNVAAIDVLQRELLLTAEGENAPISDQNDQNGQNPSADLQNCPFLGAKGAQQGPADELVHRWEQHSQHDNDTTTTASTPTITGQQQQQQQQQLFFSWAFQWFMLLHQQQQLQLQQQQQQRNSTGTSSSRNFGMVPMRHNQQQQAKMKKCLFCFEEIHRNAPTCPFCKKKITSKAAKRMRK